MSQTTTTTGAEWVVVAWSEEDGIAGAQVVQEFGSQGWADGYAAHQRFYGDPGLCFEAMSAEAARALGIE